MDLREAIKKYKQFKVPSLSAICEKASQYSKTCLLVVVIFVVFLALALQYVPQLQVAQFGITNPKDLADAENSYRATLAQILGGAAIGIGLYYTWRRINIAEDSLKVTQENLKVAQDSLKVTQENLEITQKSARDNLKVTQEGQITERFTRAVDQLGAIDQFGNSSIEIRLGGIYALERISKESEKDYWPIMEILMAYVRMNSSAKRVENKKITQATTNIQSSENTQKEDSEIKKTPLDVQAALMVLGRRKNSFNFGESNRLNLKAINLQNADLRRVHLEGAKLNEARLEKTILKEAHLEGAKLSGSHLEEANLLKANLAGANLEGANFEGADLQWANLKGTNLKEANLQGTYLRDAQLEDAIFTGANLEKAVLADSNLVGAHLERANLKEAHLEYANLKRTNIQFTNLKGAHLEWSNLEGANLSEAYLEGANLGGTKGLSLDQFSEVKTLYNAKLDEELEIQLKEKYPALFEKPDK